MKDRPIATLENAVETGFLQQVLHDRGIPFRIEYSEQALGVIIGSGAAQQWQGYARVWGYDSDATAIEQALAEVRASRPMGETEWQGSRMWRIKRP